MKTKIFLCISILFAVRATLGQGTAFTYQGRLNDGGNPAHGTYDFRFKLFVDPDGNTQAGSTILTNGLPLTDGLFTVALDFGDVFNGSNYWLEVDVRTNGGSGYANLNPLQPLLPTPYAIFANTASNLSGTISSLNLSGTYGGPVTFNNAGDYFDGTFSGNGANITNVNAATLNGLSAANFWKTSGNSGTTAGANFVGTTDNQPLELHVNNQRALRLTPDGSTNNAPNLIGGSPVNTAGSGLVGATIGGGGAPIYGGLPGTNLVLGDFNTIGGGWGNTTGATNADVSEATVAGGAQNTASGISSFIGGGAFNLAYGNNATVAGGLQNHANYHSFVGSGYANSADGLEGVIGGGSQNAIGTNNDLSTIAGGGNNTILPNVSWATIAGGTYHTIGDINGFIGGGWANTIQTNGGRYSAIVGGDHNSIQGSADHSVIGGGQNNSIVGSVTVPVFAVIAGGYGNVISSNSSFATIGGGYGNLIQTNPPYPQIQFTTIAGGAHNVNSGTYSTIGGGLGNYIFADYATISGGNGNSGNYLSTVGGGALNNASGLGSVIVGGGIWVSNGFLINVGARANGTSSAILGGALNSANGSYSAVGGGFQNMAGNAQFNSGNSPVVGGGYQNTASADFSVVPGGSNNVASGAFSLAAGKRAKAEQPGEFVWADSQEFDFDPYAQSGPQGVPNSFNVRATGGFYIVTGISGSGAILSGAYLGGSATSWSTLSDRNAKKNFAPVNTEAVLDKLAAIPVQKWNYKWEADDATPNLGPMAQDFKAAFYPGRDDKSITTLEFDGVELAAIQGLNQKLQQKDAEIQQLQQSVAELKQLVSQLVKQNRREDGH